MPRQTEPRLNTGEYYIFVNGVAGAIFCKQKQEKVLNDNWKKLERDAHGNFVRMNK